MGRYDPPLEFDTPDEDLTPKQIHDRWERATNLQAAQLRDLRDTREHDAYLEQASDGREESDGPIPGGPLDDAIHLAETPRTEWGADEKVEAREALNYARRHVPQYAKSDGEDLTPGDGVKTTKADVAHARWGFDLREDEWP
jgi:hypothetical protein